MKITKSQQATIDSTFKDDTIKVSRTEYSDRLKVTILSDSFIYNLYIGAKGKVYEEPHGDN